MKAYIHEDERYPVYSLDSSPETIEWYEEMGYEGDLVEISDDLKLEYHLVMKAYDRMQGKLRELHVGRRVGKYLGK